MTHVLDERDGWLFVKETTTDFFEPRAITHWWPTGLRYSDHYRLFADEERARATIGKPLVTLSNTTYRLDLGISGGLRITLRDGEQTKPEYTEITPIPEPMQHGRKLPVEWKNGAWYKRTARGLVLA